MKGRIIWEMQVKYFSVVQFIVWCWQNKYNSYAFQMPSSFPVAVTYSLLKANLIFIAAFNYIYPAVSKHTWNVLSGFSLNIFFCQSRRKNWNQDRHRHMLNCIFHCHGTLSKGCVWGEYERQQQQIEEKRIVQLEETYKDHWVQLPDLFRSKQKLKHIHEGIVQMSFEHWQVWDINYLSRKPVPVSDHLHSREMFPSVQCEPPLA